MNSNPYQSPETVEPPAPSAKPVRWPFAVDLAFFVAGLTPTVYATIRTNLQGWMGDWDNPVALAGRLTFLASLVVIPLANIYGWQGRPAAVKFLRIAIVIALLQAPVTIYSLGQHILDDYHTANIFKMVLQFANSEYWPFLVVIAVRTAYNIVFYYWAIAQARNLAAR